MLKSQNYNDRFRKFKDTNTGRTYLAWFVYDPDLADSGQCILFVENFISGTSKGYYVDAMPPGRGSTKARKYKFFNKYTWLMEEKVQEFIDEVEKPLTQ